MEKKYKILLFIIVIAVVILVFSLIFKNIFWPSNKITPSSTNIQIVVPDFSFSSKKNIDIKVLDRSSSEYQELINYKNFYGEIYKITFSDESNESSILPITVRYRIPKDNYFGDNFVNFSLAYITQEDPPVISEFSGEKIVKIEDEYYIEAQTFQITKVNYIGLVIESPQESSSGLKVIKESPPTLEPDIILIPGTDLNFLGKVMNIPENGYPQSFWSSLFPNRTIWSYNYPLTSTRSKNYNDSFVSFVERTGINSYIEFEGRRLAQELSRFPNKKFDIIAHGIGGLIARYALESSQTIQNVENLVLISTPNKGSNLANPLFFNLLFGKNTEILSQYFNVEDSAILKITLQISSYLDQINSYYEDLIPDSEFLNKLDSFGIRNDIRYLSVIGNNPEIEEDLSNKYISRLYPEFVQGKGDGIVSVDSANLEGIEKTYYSKKSFYEIYNDPDVLKEIVNFLEESVPSYLVEPFKDDNFVEYTYETEEGNSSSDQSKNTHPSIISSFTLPSQYKESSILLNPVKQGEIDEDTLSIIAVGENIYFKSPNSIYNSKLEKIFSVLSRK
ncbi:esterase/lipase family protein [Petrotoga sp. DB-2]